jgi:hypothetical protein
MILVTGPDSIAQDRWIQSLDRPDAGVIALVANPSSPAFWLPASQLLEKLGKQRPEPGARPDDAAILAIWLRAYRIGDVLLHHAEVLEADVLCTLDGALHAADARLWCIVHPAFLDLARVVLAKATTAEQSWASFHGHWSARSSAPAPAPSPGPVALHAEAAWRSESERLSGPAQSATMDRPYLVGFCAAASWDRERAPRRTTLASRLRGLLGVFRDPACRASAARGAAVALRDAGWDVRIDLRRVAGTSDLESPVRHLPPIRLEHLRWFRDPLAVAACVLADLMSRAEALNLRLADVADDGGAISLREGTARVPPVAEPMLRALLIARRQEGAEETDYLLADRAGPKSARWFTSTVLSLFEEIGTQLPRAEIDAQPTEDERWLQERGITFEWIPRRDRPQPLMHGWRPDAVAQAVLQRLAQEAQSPQPHPCACEIDHVPPTPEEAPVWPRPRPHAPVPASHPWRRSFTRGPGAATT